MLLIGYFKICYVLNIFLQMTMSNDDVNKYVIIYNVYKMAFTVKDKTKML